MTSTKAWHQILAPHAGVSVVHECSILFKLARLHSSSWSYCCVYHILNYDYSQHIFCAIYCTFDYCGWQLYFIRCDPHLMSVPLTTIGNLAWRSHWMNHQPRQWVNFHQGLLEFYRLSCRTTSLNICLCNGRNETRWNKTKKISSERVKLEKQTI